MELLVCFSIHAASPHSPTLGSSWTSSRSPTVKTSNTSDEEKQSRGDECDRKKTVAGERGGGSFERESKRVNVSDQGGESSWVQPHPAQLWEDAGTNSDKDAFSSSLPQWGCSPGNGASLISTSIVRFWSRQAVHVKCHDYFLIIKFAAVHSFALQMRCEAASRYDAAISRNLCPSYALATRWRRSGWVHAGMLCRIYTCFWGGCHVMKEILHTSYSPGTATIRVFSTFLYQ